MTIFKSAALLAVFGFLLASLTGSLRAAPDDTLGMALLGGDIRSDAHLNYGSGVAGVSRLDYGIYDVSFDRPVSNCFGSATTAANVGFIAVLAKIGSDTFRVYITTANLTYVDADFHLIVFCPK